ncbi:aminotransferase class V-fold PLP-dependent enzyme [Frigidibacter sp. ROC022]|uniref:aminotransferase class V-fold PLP-dependent enzyme n=1 Tax=Frigidibacter sp. ROC022 TaxID=2971796 RepID=UPI00215AFCD7|nr:aminotransferase class V-fold PLP-dependent enzyme [Frigidibacter sp. ROC022]MCR8725808.1 aminotransferase class V-fold PLP-dependent enzyme [Frigidibacter sp. ROC022]
MSPLDEFKASLAGPDLPARIRSGLIGDGVQIEGPFGPRRLLYADYVASGRGLLQVEDFIRDKVLPYYANSHTQASFCGAYTTRLREAARAEIARMTGADAATSVVFTGAGSTAGLNRIVGLLDIPGVLAQGGRAVVLVGPYEHHSNLLPWRESGATTIEIPEGAGGGPDMGALEQALAEAQGADLIVGAFSAASNVTGILTDTDAVTRMLRRHGALAIWDYGCAAPYVEMDMRAGTDAAKDAIVFSPHKFPGGPGASGVMILRDAIARRRTPTLPGGGTVSFVSPWDQVYSRQLSEREEGGTPNVTGDIRAALAMLLKEALGQDWLDRRQAELRARALAVWDGNPRIELLGRRDAEALPIFSFRIGDGMGGHVHHQLFTRLLSDVHGVQARGGCACAGSYAHRLLGLDQDRSRQMRDAILRGEELEKPGWVRLNLSALLTDEKADLIIAAVDNLASDAAQYGNSYRADPETARFQPVASGAESLAS